MKNNVLLQLVFAVALFVSVFLGLSQINWVSIFHVEEVTAATEEKLGELFWDIFQADQKEVKNPKVYDAVDSIVSKLILSTRITRGEIKLHIVKNDEINAFALPDNHLVVFTGLINECRKPEELAGVIAHELGHMERRHVMKKLSREIGTATLIAMTSGGGSGSEAIKRALSTLSSKAYERRLEREADLFAVDAMVEAGINPEPFADFLGRLADHENESVDLTWLSSHPASEHRAEYVLDYWEERELELAEKPVISAQSWEAMKQMMEDR